MNKKEIGRQGGLARAKIYTSLELSYQAQKGAKTIELLRPGFHAAIGSKGGTVRANKYNHEELSLQAQKSAMTIEKKQPGFHAIIGARGGKNSHKVKN